MNKEEKEALQALLKNLPQYGIRNVDFAQELGIHPMTLYNYTRGGNIPLSRAKQILTVLKDKYSDRVRAGLQGLEMPDSDDSVSELFGELGIAVGGKENE